MSAADRHVHGLWNVICQRCGFKYKSNQLQREWTGFIVCYGPGTNECWEPRHPQDFLRGKKDPQRVEYIRPDLRDKFVDVTYVDPTVGVQE